MNDLEVYLVLEDIHVIWRMVWMALGTFSMEAYLLGHLLGMKCLVTPRSLFSEEEKSAFRWIEIITFILVFSRYLFGSRDFKMLLIRHRAKAESAYSAAPDHKTVQNDFQRKV
jgi:hypothetical protein